MNTTDRTTTTSAGTAGTTRTPGNGAADFTATSRSEALHGPFGASDRSTGSLMRELLGEVSALARKELSLARAEMRENMAHAREGATTVSAGGVVLMGGYFVLLIAATALLAEVMEPWLAALIVGGIAAIAGWMMIKSGMDHLRSRELAPQRTMDSFHKHANAVREARHGYH